MIVCKTIEEFLDNYLNKNIKFSELSFDDNERYQELLNCLLDNHDNSDYLYMIALLYEKGLGTDKDIEKAINYYKRASELNNSKALNTLGYYYYSGVNVEKDIEKSKYYLEKASELNNSEAINNLGFLYQSSGDKNDLEKAYLLFKKSSELGSSNGMLNLFFCYFNGVGVSKDIYEAINWLEKAIEIGNSKAMYNMSWLYRGGNGIESNLSKEIYYLALASKNELPIAMYVLGLYYMMGKGVEKNPKMAFNLMEQASDKGYIDAYYFVAKSYENGTGVEQNYIEAIKYYKKADEAGNANASLALGNYYQQGLIVDKDMTQAAFYFEKAALKNEKMAMYNLAMCYEFGDGRELDKTKSFAWFMKAANLGLIEAMSRVGWAYYEGKGIEKDYEKSFNWLKLAAEKGHPYSMWAIGHLYKRGLGVKKNYELAFYWLNKAYELKEMKAASDLGDCYLRGIGTIQDTLKAKEILEESANENNNVSMFILGYMYSNEKFLEVNKELSEYWFNKAAENGNTVAMHVLALYYKEGKFLDFNIELAIKWLKKASELNDSSAMYTLSTCYEKGIIIEKNIDLSLYWLNKSAELNNKIALYELARLYFLGIEYSKDETKAFELYLKSANVGYDKAMYELANLYKQGKGVKKNIDEALKWYEKSALLDNTKALEALAFYYEEKEDYSRSHEYLKKASELSDYYCCYCLGKYYEKGLAVNIDLKEALRQYKLALNNGFEIARSDVERLTRYFEENEFKEAKLSFSFRKDTFISWNHLDKDIKDELCSNLEQRGLFTIWESDGNGLGNIDENIKNAILQAKSYLIILTGNSIRSKWVEKEVEVIFEKVRKETEYENVIRPIIIDRITNDNKVEYFDVVKEINSFNDYSIFKKLLALCSTFEDFEKGIDYEKITSLLKEAIGNTLKLEYKQAIKNKYQRFNSALNSVVASRNTKTGILAATLDYEEGYLNRDLYDSNNKPIKSSDLLLTSNPTLIYGSGGSGKSLYLRNFLRKEFKGNNYIFYLECKELINIENDYNFLSLLKEKTFDSYFANDEASLLTQYSFEQIFKSNNQIIILIDALDELPLNKRKLLINKINDFYHKYHSKLIFTSRNKIDASLINDSLALNIDIYELKGLDDKEIEILYDNLVNKYKNNFEETIDIDIDIEKNIFNILDNKDEEDKIMFLNSLSKIKDDIKKNPLLISNLIFIYFATHKIPDTSFDILNESVLILIKDLDEERSVNFKYINYIKDEKLTKLLGYIALQRTYLDSSSIKDLVKDYLLEEYENIDHSLIANEISEYLKNRSLIINENIAHEIFNNYFASSYLFNLIYKIKKNKLMKKYYTFNDEGQELLNSLCEENFVINNDTWNNIGVNLLSKLDFEIYYLDPKKEMDDRHLSYHVFVDTLNKTIREKGFNNELITIFIDLIKNNNLHYNEFIKNNI